MIEQLVLDLTDLTGLACQSGLDPEDEHRRLANATWDRSRSWPEALADHPNLAPPRADLLIRLARHAESVGFDRDTRTAWEAAVAAIEPLTLERSSP